MKICEKTVACAGIALRSKTILFKTILFAVFLTAASAALASPKEVAVQHVWQTDLAASITTSGDFNLCRRKLRADGSCNTCGGIGVYYLDGATCRGCGFFCTVIPNGNDPKESVPGSELAGGYSIPDDAIHTWVTPSMNCSTPDDEIDPETAQRVAVWNPHELLDQFKPYALAIDAASFEQLADLHPAAAYIVGLRLENDGKVIAAPDMHGMSDTIDSIFTPEYASAAAYRGRQQEASELPKLNEDRQFHFDFKTDFDSIHGKRILVRSWISNVSSPTLNDYRETVITLDPTPERESPVIASGGYPAPVYRVVEFATSSK